MKYFHTIETKTSKDKLKKILEELGYGLSKYKGNGYAHFWIEQGAGKYVNGEATFYTKKFAHLYIGDDFIEMSANTDYDLWNLKGKIMDKLEISHDVHHNQTSFYNE
tara:strand:- start:643 stop:963 length:321 start_codon:yes stop_codon:yes gene_type:complete